tara:strand:+ start:260 stop:523 length:264 start_codon:yes stop_codon:yes gene_type:complete
MAKANETKKATKLTKEELLSLQDIKTRVNDIKVEAGEFYLAKRNVEDAEKKLNTKLAKIKSDEIKISIELQKKYGEVSISLEDGAIS